MRVTRAWVDAIPVAFAKWWAVLLIAGVIGWGCGEGIDNDEATDEIPYSLAGTSNTTEQVISAKGEDLSIRNSYVCACHNNNKQFWTGLTRDESACRKLCPHPSGAGWAVYPAYSGSVLADVSLPNGAPQKKYFCSCRKPRDQNGVIKRWSGLLVNRAACYKGCPEAHPLDWAVLKSHSGYVVVGSDQLPLPDPRYLCACRKPTVSGYKYWSGLMDSEAACRSLCERAGPLAWERVAKWSGRVFPGLDGVALPVPGPLPPGPVPPARTK
jgi:hypothetical protein